MPDLKFKDNEEHLKELQEKYNSLIVQESYYPQILYWTPMQLYQRSEFGTPDAWKQFLLDPRFKEWYASEDEILTRTKAMEIQQNIGTSRSTAEATQMNSLFNKLKDLETKSTNETKIVYIFVPLSDMERNIPNVKTLDYIPDEIKVATQVIGQSSEQTSTKLPDTPDSDSPQKKPNQQ